MKRPPERPSILAVDIGNSTVKCGLFKGAELVRVFRTPTSRSPAEPGWQTFFSGALAEERVDQIGMVSVVPHVTPEVRSALLDISGTDPHLFSHRATLPFTLDYLTPETLGTDRLAAAAGAWIRIQRTCEKPRTVVVLDAGTAVTIDVVEKNGAYRGGIISPGPVLTAGALNLGTAQLPTVETVLPEHVIGRSTYEAIQSGVMFGFIESVTGLLRRVVSEEPAPAFILATGGWATLLSEHIPAIDAVEPDLVLYGIFELTLLNALTG